MTRHKLQLAACSLLLALAACGQSAVPSVSGAAAPQAQGELRAQEFCATADPSSSPPQDCLYPVDPIDDSGTPPAPSTSFYRYYTLDQVAGISSRASYAVTVARGTSSFYDSEHTQHYQHQKDLVILALQNPTPTNFQQIQSLSTPYAGLNWSSDGCSAPWYSKILSLGQTALYSQTFKPACRLHDFAYRNLGRIANEAQVASGQRDLVNHEALRKEIDDQFRSNMLAICEDKPWIIRGNCKGWAKTFASAVHNYGQNNWDIWNFAWGE